MQSAQNTPPWQPIPLGFTCTSQERSPVNLVRTLAQFAVSCSHRYDANQQGLAETYCNIFVWDATRALGCEIPHWCGVAGVATAPGQGTETSALGVIGWLHAYGTDNGWVQVQSSDALLRAKQGYPTAIVWENPAIFPDGRRHPSHVAMLLPPVADECRIAQAGGENLWDVKVERGFGSATAQAQYWTHD